MGASHSGIHVDLGAIEAPAEGTGTQDRKFGKQLGVRDEQSQLRLADAESS